MWFTRSSRLKGSWVRPQELIPGVGARSEQLLSREIPTSLNVLVCEMVVGGILPTSLLATGKAWLVEAVAPGHPLPPPGSAASHQHCG